MASRSVEAQPSPELFFKTALAYMQSAGLKAAIDLDLFTAIGKQPADAATIASRCGASERGVRALCNSLVISGFLTKEDRSYALAPDSAVFLDRQSPAFIGSAVNFLNSPILLQAFERLTEAVRQGGTAIPEQGTLKPEHPIWEKFARDMAGLAAMTAELVARLLDAGAGDGWKVLDIAAGHGLYGIAVARHNPNARVVALDWPNVLKVAQEHAEAAGVADRYATIPGSAFDVDFGSGYDIALVTGFLHHFDVRTCEKLLLKVHRALRPGGRAVAVEFVPNDDRVSPPMPANFSLMMLANTPGGDAYTFQELAGMFRTAGFARVEHCPLEPGFLSAVIAYR